MMDADKIKIDTTQIQIYSVLYNFMLTSNRFQLKKKKGKLV